jgi:flagellar biosynthetic protein FlhB
VSAGGDGQEKTEEASPRRKQQARKDGQVAKSQDLVSAAVTVVLVGMLPTLVTGIGQGFMSSVRTSLSSISTDASLGSIQRAVGIAVQASAPSLLLILGIAAGVGTVTTLAQTGLIVSMKPLTPDFKKIDPFSGFKRMFSKRSLMEGAKAFFKFLLFGWVAYRGIEGNWGIFRNFGSLPPSSALISVGEVMRGIALNVAMVWCVLAAIDYVFQRKQMDKQMKMSKDEVKREFKEQEGSPEVKAARFQRRRKLMKSRMRDAVRTADVVVTNPTHFAVALKYDAEKGGAPIVVAKGVDHLAAKIREFAREDRVPIVPNPRLARALYRQCEVGDTIPRELFAAVAEVLAYVYKVLRHMR